MNTSPIDRTPQPPSVPTETKIPFQAPLQILQQDRKFKSLPNKSLCQVMGIPSSLMLKGARAVGIGKLIEAAKNHK